jgi:formate hydrogenlyase subunit 3/multisubunit Na+/H+ antiporter MnhD subunit
MMAGSACLVAAGVTWLLPDGELAEFLGRSLVLDIPTRLISLFLFCLMGILSLYPWPARSAQLFRPFGLVGVWLMAASTLARALPLSVLLLELGALSLVIPIQADNPRSNRGAAGYLIFVVMVMACLLLGGWLVEGYEPTPEGAWVVQPVAALLTLGFGLLFGLVPFHGWWKELAENAPPPMVALVGAAIPGLGLALIMSVLARFPWLVEEDVIRPALFTLGFISAVLGAVMGLLSDPGPGPHNVVHRALGWWAIHDLGVIVVGASIGSLGSLTGAALGLVGRSLGLSLWAMAEAGGRGATGDDIGRPIMHGWRLLAILVGGWTLAGGPLSGAFPARWLVYRATFELEPLLAYPLMLSSVLCLMSFVRSFRAALSVRHAQGALSGADRTIPGVIRIIILASLALVTIALGLYPQPILQPILASLGAFVVR